MSKLLPCPLCGEQPNLWSERDRNPELDRIRDMAHIECINPLCKFQPSTDAVATISDEAKERASEFWNTRHEAAEVGWITR
jgi:hypothetical protein